MKSVNNTHSDGEFAITLSFLGWAVATLIIGTVVVITATKILSDPAVQKAIAKAVTTIGYAVKKAIKKELKSFVKDVAVGVIEGTTQWYVETVFEHSAKRIRRAILEQ